MTLQLRANVLRSNEYSVGVVGDISSGAEGEYVVVKGKECGIPGAFFRGLGGGTTLAGGRYEASVLVRTKTTLRAEWKGTTSLPVVVNKRAYITLTKEEDGFRVGVASETHNVDGKKATIERLTSTGWRKLQTVVLKAQPVTSSTRRRRSSASRCRRGRRSARCSRARRLAPATWPDTASWCEHEVAFGALLSF